MTMGQQKRVSIDHATHLPIASQDMDREEIVQSGITTALWEGDDTWVDRIHNLNPRSTIMG